MTDKEKLAKIKEAYDWCVNNTEVCEDTKYEDDAVHDNFRKLDKVCKEVFGG